LLAVGFCVVAGGNSLGGILVSRICRTWGSASYGIYLLHGLILFFAWHIVLSVDLVQAWPLTFYWIAIAVLSVILVWLSYACHVFIERPAMSQVQRVRGWLPGFKPVQPASKEMSTG
jgi:peptidoglycan/LPS O-acetylase OafA/YrhL